MNEELNRKLAKWAGFKVFEKGAPATVGYPDGHYDVVMPNFPSSLDAIFEWLVPKAIEEICCIVKVSTHSAYETLFKWWLQEMFFNLPALALCKAIEDLVDLKDEKAGIKGLKDISKGKVKPLSQVREELIGGET